MRKKKIIILGIIGFMIILGLVFLIKSPVGIALFKSKSHFLISHIDSRVMYEPGAEKYAEKISDYFPIALKTIEEKQFNPFSKSFKVYVCNTQKSLGEFVSAKSLYPIRGLSLRGNIYIAPSAFNFKGLDTHKETIMHELSHLHFRLRLGFVKYRKIPSWFHEGFADYVSGAGGEGIEDKDAIDYILNGWHFILNDEGKVFGSFRRESKNLSGPMYHKQVKMFVTYLVETDSLRFKDFILEIQKGESFSLSFSKFFGKNVMEMWQQFVESIPSPQEL